LPGYPTFPGPRRPTTSTPRPDAPRPRQLVRMYT
jgi:hypothetical protein